MVLDEFTRIGATLLLFFSQIDKAKGKKREKSTSTDIVPKLQNQINDMALERWNICSLLIRIVFRLWQKVMFMWTYRRRIIISLEKC